MGAPCGGAALGVAVAPPALPRPELVSGPGREYAVIAGGACRPGLRPVENGSALDARALGRAPPREASAQAQAQPRHSPATALLQPSYSTATALLQAQAQAQAQAKSLHLGWAGPAGP